MHRNTIAKLFKNNNLEEQKELESFAQDNEDVKYFSPKNNFLCALSPKYTD